MATMQPEPSAELREELEFRARVYKMLASGISTTEIEALMHRKIDWTLFSESTVREMSQASTKISISLPESFDMHLKTILSKIDVMELDMQAKNLEFSKLIDDLFMKLIGAIVCFGTILVIGILIALSKWN